jgi:CPA2 family monovalent cation:H+ antiporter-2
MNWLMAESEPLIRMIVGGIVAAFALGFLAHRLRISPIVGYLLAGVLIGPYTPGFIADPDLAGELAELGVILIMFGVGLKFSPRQLADVNWVIVPCALGQMAVVTALGCAFGMLLKLPLTEAVIFGFCLSVASTVVLLRALEDRHLSQSPAGKAALCWLIVQDLVAVLALVVVSVMAQHKGAGGASSNVIIRGVGVRCAELAAFAFIMLVVGRRILPGLLVFIAKAKSRELFSLGVFAIALGIAYLANHLFGAGFALGAFFAGLVLNEAELSQRAAEDILPLRNAFSVLFFVSAGMLFDPHILVTHGWVILGVLSVIILANGGAVLLLTTVARVPPEHRQVLAPGLAQIGEFSFLISGLAMSLGLMSEETQMLIAAAALISITLNPLLHYAADFIMSSNGSTAADPEKTPDAA